MADNLSFPERENYIHNVYKRYMDKMTWMGREAVLDVACWKGQVTKAVLLPLCEDRHATIIAVDRFKEAIEFAEENCHHRDITYQVLDVTSKPVPSSMRQKFRKVFFCYLPSRAYDQHQIISNLNQFMADGAEFVFIITIKCCLFPIMRLLGSSDKWKLYMRDYEKLIPPLFDWTKIEEKYNQEAEKAGFAIKYAHLDETHILFPTVETFREFLKQTLPFYSRVPEDKRTEYLNEAFQMALKHGATEESDGSIKYHMTLFNIYGEKIKDI